MHTLEWIIGFTLLLGAAGILSHAIGDHLEEWKKTRTIWEEKNHILTCSAEWDRANSHFVIILNGKCTNFSFSLHEDEGNPFLMGMDGNHYA